MRAVGRWLHTVADHSRLEIGQEHTHRNARSAASGVDAFDGILHGFIQRALHAFQARLWELQWPHHLRDVVQRLGGASPITLVWHIELRQHLPRWFLIHSVTHLPCISALALNYERPFVA